MNVGFFVRHFLERGTEVAIYDYAHYNETLLNNKSFIICFTPEAQKQHNFTDERISYNRFKARFPIIEIHSISQMKEVIQQYNLSFFYTLTYGGGGDIYQFDNKELWGACKTIKHCIFHTTYPEADVYLSISSYLNKKNSTSVPVVPHIVCLPETNQSLRSVLQIPEDALVFGRYGGFDDFSIGFASQAIIEYLHMNPNVYFIFMNTPVFYAHPRMLFLDKTTDPLLKSYFINTCDAMIHARIIGETFGLSIAEFSSKNKPVITCPCGDLEHTILLGDKGIYYTSKEELLTIFTNFRQIRDSKSDWNAYRFFSPENIMEMFRHIFNGKLPQPV